MPEALVSILIAAYNAERYVEETMQSVIAQSWPRIETIVVDDGSTDRTPTILSQYEKFPHVKLFRQENRGQCAARNRAVAHAHGNFVKFLDADDLLAPDAVA